MDGAMVPIADDLYLVNIGVKEGNKINFTITKLEWETEHGLGIRTVYGGEVVEDLIVQ